MRTIQFLQISSHWTPPATSKFSLIALVLYPHSGESLAQQIRASLRTSYRIYSTAVSRFRRIMFRHRRLRTKRTILGTIGLATLIISFPSSAMRTSGLQRSSARDTYTSRFDVAPEEIPQLHIGTKQQK